ncbi:hypothetical protein RAM19_11900 [Bartonella apihabitans]|nr:hypothetical protein [Bartonella apihabitans]WLT08670.1 hypothetical protein RAM19_11900 [Bartonella apihabitans]
MKKILLASVFASSMLAPAFISSALAAPTPPPAHGEHQPKPPHHKGPEAEETKGAERPEHFKGPHAGMHMAEKLSAMETALGIRTNQLDAWRKYTSSLVDLVDVTPPPPPAPDAKPAPDAVKPIFGEPIADRAIDRAEKAKKFKTAAEELRKVLDADQLSKLERYALPHPGPKNGPEGPKGPDAPEPPAEPHP